MNKYNLAHEFTYWKNHNEKFILRLCLFGITLNSANSLAVSKASYYPATNFQPKMIFIDKEAAKASRKKLSLTLNIRRLTSSQKCCTQTKK
jgi:hypothetical protein